MFFRTPSSIRALSPFGQPVAPPSPMRQQRPHEPEVKLVTMHDAYVLELRAPEGVALTEPSAYVDRENRIVLEGALVAHQRSSYIYRCRRQVAAYAEPSPFARPVEVLPPGSCVHGSAPSRQGWIGLESDYEDEELYVRDDGGLVLIQRPARAEPQPFVRRLNLPADSDLQHASCSKMRGGGAYTVTVPRHPAPTHQAAYHAAHQATHQAAQHATQHAAHQTANQTGPRSAAAKISDAHIHTQIPRSGPASPASKGMAKGMHSGKENRIDRSSRVRTTAREAAVGSRDALRSELEPVLQECSASPENVSTPSETVQHWVAAANGGFLKIAAAA